MRLLISKLIRIVNKDITPINCYYTQYLPDSLNDNCDCKVFCKFPPKGNASISLFPNNKEQINHFQLPHLIPYTKGI